MLHSLQGRFGKNIGLYRDDGLALIQTKSGRLSDKARKDLIQTFNDFGLKITAQVNQQLTNFLDLTLNLTDGTYKPYRKPNDKPLYINRSSNHSPSIICQLPLSINRHINTLSCDKQAFDSTVPLYNDALKHSNFDTQLTYNPIPKNPRRNRQRNTIWYSSPFNKNVRTNIAHDFLQLIDKHFPPANRLSTLFERHTVRVSYNCTENMKSVISKHNKTILRKHDNPSSTSNTNNNLTRPCNCRQATECPVNGKCLEKSVV